MILRESPVKRISSPHPASPVSKRQATTTTTTTTPSSSKSPSRSSSRSPSAASPAISRRDTFLEIPQRKTTGQAPDSAATREVLTEGQITACVGSNKAKRLGSVSTTNGRDGTKNKHVNEDKVYIAKTEWQLASDDREQTTTQHAWFIGMFDGHGGRGAASTFVAEHLPMEFEQLMTKHGPVSAQDEIAVVCNALELAFANTDFAFHEKVQSEAKSLNLVGTKRYKCTCRFFLEDPCDCLGPKIPANEGTTATVIIMTRTHVITANVGDSDAVLFSTDEHGKLSGTRLTVTDTPVVDESNPDYLRIRDVAHDRQKTYKSTRSGLRQHASTMSSAPKDGIQSTGQGIRFNYVSIPGAHSLNMVRAFGNLGHKHFGVEGRVDEKKSGIISRPHIKVTVRSDDMRVIVLGSDGLWDNRLLLEVSSVLNAEANALMGKDGVSAITKASKTVAEQLLSDALGANRKPDDITVIVVPLSHDMETS